MNATYFLLPFLFSLLFILPQFARAQRVIYVDQIAVGANDGTSVLNAYESLQDALFDANAGDEIRVMAGVYTPDQGQRVTEGDRNASFILKNDVRLIGGFNREDVSPDNFTFSAWDWRANPTILSGDLLGNDNGSLGEREPTRIDNSLHVIRALSGTDTTAIMEGFFIENGHRNISSTKGGAGLWIDRSNLRLSHLEFRNHVSKHSGGALYSEYSSLWLSDVSFLDNRATEHRGGALYSETESDVVYIRDSFFARNRGSLGGAMYIIGGGLFVTETTFLQNEGYAGGAVMHQLINPEFGGSEAVYSNVAFLGNKVTGDGGAICNEDASIITIYNGLFSGNKAIMERPGFQPLLRGGAIVNFEHSVMNMYQTTFVNNTARDGGAIYMSSGNVAFYNSILQSNRSDSVGTEDISFDPDFGTMTLNHNIVGLMHPGAIDEGGNTLNKALFANHLGLDGIAGTLDDDLRPLPGSPSIDVGNNDILPADVLDIDQDGDVSETLPLDIDRHERIADGNVHGLHVDLGAYEFNASAPISTHSENPGSTTICPSGPLTPAYPNPFISQTNLTICVPATGRVEVSLYDILGRRKALVFDRVIQANQPYPLLIDRNDLASGVYFVRLKHANTTATRSITLMH